MPSKDRKKIEYGDFQTPLGLAKEVCSLLAGQGITPKSVVEPTCGRGSFLTAALGTFPSVRRAIGVDINIDHVAAARNSLKSFHAVDWEVRCADYFSTDWEALIQPLPDPLLILGNPPWATNSDLALLDSSNLPEKSNFQARRGIEAITWGGNFDISEWMLLQVFKWMSGRESTLAMLCKTSVARRVLCYLWESHQSVGQASMYAIDSMRHFGVSVDACLLVLSGETRMGDATCHVYESLDSPRLNSKLGFRGGRLVTDVDLYERWEGLLSSSGVKWRSGIKHDCAKVMELRGVGSMGEYENGMGELVNLEEYYLYPMLKSSDLAKMPEVNPARFMLVPQSFVGQETDSIEETAPLTWDYLQAHGSLLAARRSSVYRGKPRFSVFSVGGYSFTDWKVAVSGFYKNVRFRAVGPSEGRPVVLDDTCYFLPCPSQESAENIAWILNTPFAQELLSVFLFSDSKRPVTAGILQRVDLVALANEVGGSAPSWF